jgi:hypothetical protein
VSDVGKFIGELAQYGEAWAQRQLTFRVFYNGLLSGDIRYSNAFSSKASTRYGSGSGRSSKGSPG